MTIGSMIYLRFAVPDPPAVRPEDRLHAVDLPTILRHPPVLLVDIGVFLLHTVVTLLFVLLPFELERSFGPRNTWIVLVAALLALCCLVFALAGKTIPGLLAGLLVFVLAVGILEPILASLLSRFAEGPHRGTTTGVYSMFQYAGAFLGGLLGGAFLNRGQTVLFLGLFLLTLGWGLVLARVGHLRPEVRCAEAGQSDRPEPPKGTDNRFP